MSYNFFSPSLFGLDVPLERVVRYFETAAQGHETRRRILLLWGPPGGAKSSVAGLLKRGLEDWTATDDGAVYALAGLPDARGAAAPDPRRRCVRRRASTPGCRSRARCARSASGRSTTSSAATSCASRSSGSRSRRRAAWASARSSRAIPKSMSMEQLTGGLDFKAIETHGSDSHPLALDWAGRVLEVQPRALRGRRVLQEPRGVPQPVPDDGAGEAVQGRQVRLHRLATR